MLAIRHLTLLALVSLPIACSSGSSGSGSSAEIAVTQFAGVWRVTTTPRTTTCPPLGAPESVEITIAVSGATATISQQGEADFTMPIVNGRIAGTIPGDPSEVQELSLGLTSTAAFSGTITSRYAGPGGTSTCTDVDDISATRINNNSVPSEFTGTWSIAQTVLPNACGIPAGPLATEEVTITVAGSIATLVTLGETFTLSVVSGRLQGVSSGRTYDLGLTSSNSLSGTASMDLIFTTPPCNYVIEISGTRINNNNSGPSEFNGTWSIAQTILPNACGIPAGPLATEEVTITVAGSIATLVTTGGTFTLSVVNGRLQGDNNGGTYDLGLTSSNSLSGTVSVDLTFTTPPCTYTSELQGTRV